MPDASRHRRQVGSLLPASEVEARELTDRIRSTAEELWSLLLDELERRRLAPVLLALVSPGEEVADA